jgi:hypothetical protein
MRTAITEHPRNLWLQYIRWGYFKPPSLTKKISFVRTRIDSGTRSSDAALYESIREYFTKLVVHL